MTAPVKHYAICGGCGHKTMSTAVADQAMVIYWRYTKRDIAKGKPLCLECWGLAQPADQLYLFNPLSR